MLRSLVVIAALACIQSPRAAIERQYERLSDAIRRRDVDAILALQSPAYTARAPDGATLDYAWMAAYTRRFGETVDSVIHVRNAIREFRARGDTAVADVCQEFSRLQRLRDGRQHRIDTSALQEETWVRGDSGWLRYRVENIRGLRWFVDGVRVDPSQPLTLGAPPFQPSPDPPTGCGI
jgi:hypothetical protein